MIYDPEKQISNKDLLGYGVDGMVLDTISAVAADRPLKDRDEASNTARCLSNVLAFVNYAILNETGFPGDEEAVFNGLREITSICSLLSLRVEQYIDLQARGER